MQAENWQGSCDVQSGKRIEQHGTEYAKDGRRYQPMDTAMRQSDKTSKIFEAGIDLD